MMNDEGRVYNIKMGSPSRGVANLKATDASFLTVGNEGRNQQDSALQTWHRDS